jgi:hypothetical protein
MEEFKTYELTRCPNSLFIYPVELTRCPNSIFIYSVTEEEVISLTKSLKGKPTSGDEDIPENLVKQCIHLINPLPALTY